MNPYRILLELPDSPDRPDYYELLGLPRFEEKTVPCRGAIALSPDGTHAVFQNENGRLLEWSVDQQQAAWEIPLNREAHHMHRAVDLAEGNRLLICTEARLQSWEIPRDPLPAAPISTAGTSDLTGTTGRRMSREVKWRVKHFEERTWTDDYDGIRDTNPAGRGIWTRQGTGFQLVTAEGRRFLATLEGGIFVLTTPRENYTCERMK